MTRRVRPNRYLRTRKQFSEHRGSKPRDAKKLFKMSAGITALPNLALGVLRRSGVRSRLSRYTRSNDFVARIGGEKFVVLLPDTCIEDATRFAEKLRALIASAEFEVDGVEIAVTISCGLSPLKPRNGAEQLYRRADEALYAAKDAGRNRCIAA